ncbi:hypothetical protein D9M68_883110 [compost metagenome]
MVIGGAVVTDDQHDIAAALAGEPLDRQGSKILGMEIVIGVRRIELRASMADEGEIGIDHHLHARIARAGMGDDDAIGGAIAENVTDRIGRQMPLEFGDHRQVVARALDGMANALDHVAGKID